MNFRRKEVNRSKHCRYVCSLYSTVKHQWDLEILNQLFIKGVTPKNTLLNRWNMKRTPPFFYTSDKRSNTLDTFFKLLKLGQKFVRRKTMCHPVSLYEKIYIKSQTHTLIVLQIEPRTTIIAIFCNLNHWCKLLISVLFPAIWIL